MLLCPLHTHTSPKRTSSRVTDDEPSFTVTVCAVSPPTRELVIGVSASAAVVVAEVFVVVVVEVVMVVLERGGRQRW